METDGREGLDDSHIPIAFPFRAQRKIETRQDIGAQYSDQECQRSGAYKGSWQQEQKQYQKHCWRQVTHTHGFPILAKREDVPLACLESIFQKAPKVLYRMIISRHHRCELDTSHCFSNSDIKIIYLIPNQHYFFQYH